ncbi:TonB-dependent receptor domain-containing protein [Shimia sp. MMG029]|uniref:TonB-dependent receptor domain-containing protein n=1 Tax=Shimia sp. MMG029 TaxID=3021978 RepID=UPI0022FF3D36|nr:TonB-dependent receptor [Shimia sp. MMG029]MDA5555433.1 TonB-dependent receptor [Shimia sp. MMG029]
MAHPLVRLSLLASTALCTPLLAGAASAQDTGELFELEDIRIESDDAQSVLGNHEVSEEDIERRNPASISDVFDGESAISVSGGAAIAKKVFVNGIEESLLSVTIDGARQNKSAFHHTGNVLIDPGLLKAVEISSGLAPADEGPGGLGGSIAYTTKDAADLLEAGDSFGGQVTLGGGDNGFGLRSALTLYGQSGGFDYVLHGAQQNGSDYKDGSGTTVEGTEPDISDYLAKFSYTSETGHRVAFSASETRDTGNRAAQVGPGPFVFIRPDFSGLTSGPNQIIDALARRSSYALTYTKEDATGWFDPFFQLAYNEQEIDAGDGWGENTSFSGTFKNNFALSNGSVSAGLDFFNEKAEGRTVSSISPARFGGREEMKNIGVFVQARQDLGARTSVSYGARFDAQEFTGADNSEHSDQGFSANAAIDYHLTDTLTLNAGIASTFGGYALGEAMIINFFTPWNYDGFTTARSNSARLGLRFDNGPWVVSGALFHTEIDDLAAVFPAGGARGFLRDVKTQGFDGSIAYAWNTGFARMNYTFADVTENGDTIGSRAYHRGRPLGHLIALESAWQPWQGWTLGGTAEIAPKYSDANMPAYSVWNAYAEYVPPTMDNLRIRLDLRNLFDETYVARANDSAGDTTSRAIPMNEPGRTIALTATMRF